VLSNILRAGGTRVVIVSGRRAEELLPLLPLDRRRSLGIARPRASAARRHAAARRAEEHERSALEEAAAALEPALHAGCASSARPRASPCTGAALRCSRFGRKLRAAASETWKSLARDHGLECLPFDGGLELRVPGCTKGDVVRRLLADATPGSAVAYLGDDITDEDAFDAVKPCGITACWCGRSNNGRRWPDVWLRLRASWWPFSSTGG